MCPSCVLSCEQRACLHSRSSSPPGHGTLCVPAPLFMLANPGRGPQLATACITTHAIVTTASLPSPHPFSCACLSPLCISPLLPHMAYLLALGATLSSSPVIYPIRHVPTNSETCCSCPSMRFCAPLAPILLHSFIPTCLVTRLTQAAGPCGDRSAAGGAASCGLVRADCPGGAILTPESRSAPRPKDAEHLPYTPRDREGEWTTKPRRALL